MGYPGNLKVVARYQWSEDNRLQLTFTAQSDKATVVNLTNHVYFNLDGEGSGSVLEHVLKLNASEYLPSDPTLIPLGDSEPVAGTPMDFINPKPIGRDIKAGFEPLRIGKGYDHCFVIDDYAEGQLADAAQLYSPKSGRKVKISTTQPGIQVYTGNHIGRHLGKGGAHYRRRCGVALETQFFPNSANDEHFKKPLLEPGKKFTSTTIYKFV